jgi:predicted  nucleic acid-binding Zn-ribbon protein
MPTGEKGLLMRCVQCGELYPGSLTNDDELMPDGPAAGGKCHQCGSDEFEHVTFTPSD